MATDFTEEEFSQITAPLEKELIVHCYRFMGSLQDSEDMLQETLLRAWNRRASLKSKDTVRAWMYKIATNVCLDQLKQKKRRGMPHLQFPAADPSAAFPPPVNEPVWLEPYPDHLLPEERVTTRETISLAFMTALHLLPPQQRAVLLLIDVLDWAAKETADALELSVSSVNSALYRARKKLKENTPGEAHDWPEEPKARPLLEQYLDAWENADIEALTAILKDDAVFSMPPFSCWYAGRDAIHTMAGQMLLTKEAAGLWKLTATRANHQPAFALYQLNPETRSYHAFGLMVLTLHKEKIAGITAFLDPAIFSFFKLPEVLLPTAPG